MAMKEVIEGFWKICLLKLAPQDLPASGFLMLISTLAYMLINTIGALLILSPMQAILSAILEVALVGAMTQLLLWIKEMGARFQQTFTALMGSGAIIVALALPLSFIQMQVGEQSAVLPSVMILGLMIWNLAIVGHILRNAISSPFFVGVLLAIIYMYVLISVSRSLFLPST